MTRKETLLKLIVQHFIKTAEPVPSKTIVELYGLNYSSATIRAEMNELEKEGYLEKPHTSAGRIPSKKGYEYYIAHLRDNSINEEVKHRLQTVMDDKIASVESIINKSCEILTDMTNLVSVVSSNKDIDEHLINLQIIPISNNSATAVLITDKGYVENKTFIFEKDINVDDIKKIMKLFDDRLKGTSIKDLIGKAEAIKPILSDYVIEHDIVYQAMLETFIKLSTERYQLYGKDELFNQPEFKEDINKLKKAIELLDNPSKLSEEILKANNAINENISVHIADKEDVDNDMSIVKASVSIGGKNEGTISLLGPTRMDYDKAVSLLDYIVNTINERFTNKGGTGDVSRRENRKEGEQEGNQIKRKTPKRTGSSKGGISKGKK